jgi:2-polyprenyl-3-methyl-5-hydroxy-6-metoxy-1,4-benzoquinol methylase
MSDLLPFSKKLPDRLPFRLHDFTRLAWVSDAARKAWEPRINRVAAAIPELELRSIESGGRRAALRVVSDRDLDSFRVDLTRRGLAMLQLQGLRQSRNYSTTLAPSPGDKPDAYWCTVGLKHTVGRVAGLFADNDNDAIGEMLGYPACCVSFFKRIWVIESMVDTTWSSAASSDCARFRSEREVDIPAAFGCATHLRWLGVRAVFHLPCSYDCEESNRLARHHLDLARNAGFFEEADWLHQMLGWPAEWSALHGIAEIRTPVVKVVTRTDATTTKYVVRYHGRGETSLPEEAASGLDFPFRSRSLPLVTSSRSYSLGLTNPINERPESRHETESWYHEDNGFRTRYAMDRAHAPIVARVTQLVSDSPAPRSGMRIIDFGCGNGALLRKITVLSPGLTCVGIDLDPAKLRHGQIIHAAGAEFVPGDIFACDRTVVGDDTYLAIIMIGRLLEVPTDTARQLLDLLQKARHILVYAYEDYIAKEGALADMALRAGLTIIDKESSNVGLVELGAVALTPAAQENTE